MHESIFYQLSLVLAVAAVVSLLFNAFRQPLIIGYIVTGFLVGPTFLDLINNHEAFASFSQIGIALLLFIIGMGLSVGVIRSTGKPVFVTFFGMIIGVGGVTFLVSRLLGMTPMESILMSLALLFSSTIIVIKAVSDKKEQSRLYAQIAIGILLVDDVVATLALVFVSAKASGTSSVSDAGMLLVKGGVLAAALTVLGGYVLPRTVNALAKSQELLFIFALSWAFGVASVFWWYGFSIEVGALFAGVAMAHLPYAQQVSSRLKPLRDFFIVLFFVELGQNMGLDNVTSALVPAIIFSVIALTVKPLSVLVSLGLLGYTKQTSFKAATHVSQISEFSIILVVLAANVGVVDERIAAIVTMTAIITIILSAYLMKYDDALYRRFQKSLSLFERSETKREIRELKSYPLVLLGYRKGGHEFVRTFREMKRRYIVIDYDPDVIETLENQHVNHLYGDVTDLELLEELGLHKAELIVSTIADIEANLIMLQYLRRHSKETIYVCHANTYDEAVQLYEKGAGYVLLPHLIGSEQVNSFLRRNGSDRKAFDAYRNKHLDALASS